MFQKHNSALDWAARAAAVVQSGDAASWQALMVQLRTEGLTEVSPELAAKLALVRLEFESRRPPA